MCNCIILASYDSLMLNTSPSMLILLQSAFLTSDKIDDKLILMGEVFRLYFVCAFLSYRFSEEKKKRRGKERQVCYSILAIHLLYNNEIILVLYLCNICACHQQFLSLNFNNLDVLTLYSLVTPVFVCCILKYCSIYSKRAGWRQCILGLKVKSCILEPSHDLI